MDDVVKSLLRFVTRGFYSVPYVLIMDAVIKHSVLSEDDLIHLLSIKRKELRSLCNKLVDDRLLVNHIQKEESGQPNGQPNGQPKFVTRTYFFIHVTEAIDSIKWKVHYIVNQLKQEMSHFGNPQGYACPRCGKKVSQLDAISLLSEDKTEFLCDVCGGTLVEDDSSQQATLRQEKLEKLMFQVDPIINYLKKIDESNIQDNDFETALIQAIPAQSTSTASYTISNRISSRSRSNMSSSLQNAASKSQATLHVSITANDENYEREQMEKERRRQKLEQNALPSWHSNSTVGKSSLGRLVDEDDYSREGTPVKEENGTENGDGNGAEKENESGIKQENEDNMDIDTTNNSIEPSTGQSSVAPTPEPKAALSEIKDKEQQDALAAYYSQLAEREAEEDEDDDDDDDEDDFDDLI